MNITPRDRLVSVLDREFGDPGFSATAEVSPDVLGLEIIGAGAVKFPVTPAQARKPRGLGTPVRCGAVLSAPSGLGEGRRDGRHAGRYAAVQTHRR